MDTVSKPLEPLELGSHLIHWLIWWHKSYWLPLKCRLWPWERILAPLKLIVQVGLLIFAPIAKVSP